MSKDSTKTNGGYTPPSFILIIPPTSITLLTHPANSLPSILHSRRMPKKFIEQCIRPHMSHFFNGQPGSWNCRYNR